MSIRICFGLLALAATLAACERAALTGSNQEASNPNAVSESSRYSVESAAMDRLARRLARALADPAFRAYIKGELDQSQFVEHKLQFQRLLHRSDGRVLKQVARLSASADSAIEADARIAIPLELYFPVPAHRAAWSGGPEVLVASARKDRDAPVAYDVRGRRRVLSPDTPPPTPVLALVPVETDFDHPTQPEPFICCADGPAPSPPPGLYMTYSHFVQDFEGWFKGSPEFEIHVLGQAGTTDSLKDYQCVGEPAGGYYRFDQNSLDWSGSVMLFSQTQLTDYRTAHPNQNFRIIALEDDDTGCVIKFDSNRFKNLLAGLQAAYPNLTGGKDTTSALVKLIKRANALQKLLSQAYSFITTQDDLIGNAIEDVVVGQFYPGANWIVKGEGNVTKGWIKLQMR